MYVSDTAVREVNLAEIDTIFRNNQGETFGRPKRRREDNIQIDLTNIRCETVEWFQLVQWDLPITGLCEHGDKRDSRYKTLTAAEKLMRFERKSYSKALAFLDHIRH